MSNWEKLTDEFDAESEEGLRVHIFVYTMMVDAGWMSDSNAAPRQGLKRVCTSDGQDCICIDDDTFEIVGLGIRVKRV